MLRISAFALACFLLPLSAVATPYIPPEEAMQMTSTEQEFSFARGVPSPFDYVYDPMVRFEMGADFITTLQVSDTASAAYGGMREGEHMLSIIQTDNTSESIWIWTHYYALTGNDDYHDNIDAAWEYCMNNPAYDEEGGDSQYSGYYRRYNCAWALRAEMEYRQVYGDNTYAAYAESCASYLCHNPLRLTGLVGMYRKLNGLIMGWAVGNLYEYGTYVGDPIYVSKAVDMADSVKNWADANPNRLSWMEWAMEGGAVMWGVVNSWFQEYPADLTAWADSMAPYLNAEIDSSEYQNAWRGWAALGQFTAGEVLGSSVYMANFKHLADTLVLNDGDSDGGIPVIDAEPDDHDQTWVTNYVGYMCMDNMLTLAGLRRPDMVAGTGLRAVVTPLPAYDAPSIRFALPGPSRVSVEVFDVAGRSVYREDVGMLGGGSHVLPLFRPPEAGPASAGVYFYVLRSGTDVAKGKIVMLR
jgi:hypothetical protein